MLLLIVMHCLFSKRLHYCLLLSVFVEQKLKFQLLISVLCWFSWKKKNETTKDVFFANHPPYYSCTYVEVLPVRTYVWNTYKRDLSTRGARMFHSKGPNRNVWVLHVIHSFSGLCCGEPSLWWRTSYVESTYVLVLPSTSMITC